MSQLTKYLPGIEARDAYFRGADKVADIVTQSIGPFGLNLAMEKGKKTTNDGYLISKTVSDALKDEFEKQGAMLQHEASSKTNDKVADATSTTIALTRAIRKELLKHLPTKTRFVSTKSIDQLAKDLRKERDFVLEELKKDIQTVDTEESLINSARVSVEDPQLAELIAKTQWELGKDGRIVPEEVNEDESSIEKVDGILIDSGFVSSLMINDEKEQALIVKGGSLLLTNYTIGQKEFPLLQGLIRELAIQGETNLVIMARAFTQDVISICNDIRLNTGFNIFLTNAPYTDQSQILKDIEAVTGAVSIDQDERTIDTITVEQIGKFSHLKMRIMGGIITGIKGREDKIQERIKQLEQTLEGEKSPHYQKKIGERLAQLKGGFALLKIGGYILDDRSRLKDKADDAVVSVRLALQGGTVKGGGLAFKEISDRMDTDSLLKRPLLVIYNQIISSAPEGYTIEDWVRDPYITLETALTNACESAISMSRINGAVVSRTLKPKDQEYENQD